MKVTLDQYHYLYNPSFADYIWAQSLFKIQLSNIFMLYFYGGKFVSLIEELRESPSLLWMQFTKKCERRYNELYVQLQTVINVDLKKTNRQIKIQRKMSF